MNILLTGATGFIGSELSRQLLSEGHVVSALVRQEDKSHPISVQYQYPIVNTSESIFAALKKTQPDVVIHLASLFLSEHLPEQVPELISSNVLLGSLLLEGMKLVGCNALINAGTAWQHFENHDYNPVNLYAATKQAFEDIALFYSQAYGMRVIHIHLFDSYGETDRRPKLLQLLQKSALDKKTLAMSPGEQEINISHVSDICHGFSLAIGQVLSLPHKTNIIRSLAAKETISLRCLVEYFNDADPAHPVDIQWGSRPYRAREVMETWKNHLGLEGYHPSIELRDGLAKYRRHHTPAN